MPTRPERGPFRLVPYFSSIRFDRAAHLRGDAVRLRRLKADPATRFVPVWRGRHLMTISSAPALARLTLAELDVRLPDLTECRILLLGEDAHGALFGCDLSRLDAPPQPAGYTYAELRPYDFSLSYEEAALAAQLRMALAKETVCTPLAVVLPVLGDRVLLARSHTAHNPRLMSALAAAIEPGEMLEQAAARKVLEETGVRARRLQYHSSQPWPFPNMILTGFHLLAEMDEIRLGDGDVAEARWLTREEVLNHDELGFDLPDARTIAGEMLRRWMVCCDMFGKDNPPRWIEGRPVAA